MRILYLAHDLEDAAIWRRVSMLRAGGAEVTVAGFYRTKGFEAPEGIVLGRTANGRLGQRAAAVLRASVLLRHTVRRLPPPDVVLARNLEMLALGAQLRGPALVYEVLDIHWTMLGNGVRARMMRALEARLARRIHLLLTSSPAFDREYFSYHKHIAAPIHLVENKIFSDALPAPSHQRRGDGPLVIGWFGILRCARSLDWLDDLTRRNPGRFRILLRGRPDRGVVPRFDAVVAANPDMSFEGSYRYPADLADLYGCVDLAWLIDCLDAGANSDWLLPNRLYEGSYYGAVPIGLHGTETARYLRRRSVGVILPDLEKEGYGTLLQLDPARVATLREDLARLPTSTWTATASDCRSLVEAMRPAPPRSPSMASAPTAAES